MNCLPSFQTLWQYYFSLSFTIRSTYILWISRSDLDGLSFWLLCKPLLAWLLDWLICWKIGGKSINQAWSSVYCLWKNKTAVHEKKFFLFQLWIMLNIWALGRKKLNVQKCDLQEFKGQEKTRGIPQRRGARVKYYDYFWRQTIFSGPGIVDEQCDVYEI